MDTYLNSGVIFYAGQVPESVYLIGQIDTAFFFYF